MSFFVKEIEENYRNWLVIWIGDFEFVRLVFEKYKSMWRGKKNIFRFSLFLLIIYNVVGIISIRLIRKYVVYFYLRESILRDIWRYFFFL